MCSRFSLTSPVEAIRQLFGFNDRPNLPLSYNIAPTSYVLALRPEPNEEGQVSAFKAHWGLVPNWAKDMSAAPRLINARAETVDEKPSFKEAFQSKRCLIPANGFFEWKTDQEGEKQPYYFQSANAPLFAFAGLWESWQSPEGQTIESCTILTKTANEAIAPIHSRMPLTVKAEFADRWLNGRDKTSLPTDNMQEEFTYYPVSKKVGNVRMNTADLIQEIKIETKPVQGSLF